MPDRRQVLSYLGLAGLGAVPLPAASVDVCDTAPPMPARDLHDRDEEAYWAAIRRVS